MLFANHFDCFVYSHPFGLGNQTHHLKLNFSLKITTPQEEARKLDNS
jgi:hypothetical protein